MRLVNGRRPGRFTSGDPVEIGIAGGVFVAAGAAGGRLVDLRGAYVTPGFVDAHAHLTMTGLMLDGLDLHGVADVREMKRRLNAFARRDAGRFLWGQGWDDTQWPSPPDAALVDAAAGDRHVYLSRVDAHSALVSTRLLHASGAAKETGCERDGAGAPTGIVRRDAHHAVRSYVLSRMPLSQIRRAHRAAAAAAVAKGVTTVHDMSGPLHGAGERDLDLVLRQRLPLTAVCYYASDDLRIATTRGLRQIGGDVNVDGALGSRTAALSRPYADVKGHRGFLYRDEDDLAGFFESATRAGLQAAVHCIGDAACEAAVAALEATARRCGLRRVRPLRHRLEHFEMASRRLVDRAAKTGASFSVQPAFDAEWGGFAGMYAARAGARRAASMNDFAAMVASGATVGFGSDSPITPFDPLRAIRSAVRPSNPRHAITPEHAWRAATEGAASLAHEDVPAGRIAAGLRADAVVWDGDPVRSPDASIVATIARGKVVHGSL